MRHNIVLLSSAWLLFALPPAALASPDEEDIVLATYRGTVEISSRGAPLELSAGAVLALAATVRTGADGSAELRQGDTSISVGADTRLEFPAQATVGPIDHVSQPSGNAFYSVGPRGSRKLRVETPYLVAVIKGTQFNVAVTSDSSTISLHEGVLEILATVDGIAPVILRAGEVAVRRKDDTGIRVLKVGAAASVRDAFNGTEYPDPGDDGPQPGDTFPTDDDGISDELVADANSPLLPDDVGLTGGAGGIDTGFEVSVDLGVGTVGVDVDTGIDAGIASVDTSVDAGVDLGAGTVDAGVDAGVDTGVASVDTSVDAAADLGAGTIDAGVEADVAGADAGVDVGVDLSGDNAGVGVSVDVLGTDIDLGLGGSDASGAPDTPGGILGGLLGRPRS